MPMMAITTSNSISVKAIRGVFTRIAILFYP
jgi:hypothetical protein